MLREQDAMPTSARAGSVSPAAGFGGMTVTPKALRDTAQVFRVLAAQVRNLDLDSLTVSAGQAGNPALARALAQSAQARRNEVAALISDLNRQADGLEEAARTTVAVDGGAAQRFLDVARNAQSGHGGAASGEGN